MPSLSIKDVPADVLERLRQRAARNHRSLQGELMDIIARAAGDDDGLTVEQFYERMAKLGRSAQSDSGEILRTLRDERYGD